MQAGKVPENLFELVSGIYPDSNLFPTTPLKVICSQGLNILVDNKLKRISQPWKDNLLSNSPA